MQKINTLKLILCMFAFLGLSNLQQVIANTITPGTISPLSYCAGGSISIPFTITGTFTSGNVFKAQLSDSAGGFGSPTQIGTLTSTIAGTISATLPVVVIQGTHYRVRVISTTPAITGSANTSNITIYSLLILPPTYMNQINVSCHGGNNGQINTAIAGGTPGYTYLWSPGGSTTATISNLSAGIYNVTFTDAMGCTAFGGANITQPSALTASISSQTNVLCHGNSTGSATVTASGGTTSYTYLWSNSATTTAISGLAAGNYTVTVTDAHSCTATTVAAITQPSAALSANMTAHTNVSCFSGSNGLLTASGSGGTSPYTYLWSNTATTSTISGLVAGTYLVTVTDHNGCTATNTATISQPTALTATISDTIIYSIGIAVVTASGGTSPYTYLWSPMGQTTTTIVSSELGGNSVVVTDAHGCTATLNQPITLPDTEAIAGVTVFYPNFGQVKDTRDSVSTSVKFYTMYDYPKNYFLLDTISYVFSKIDTSSSHHDTLQRVDLSFVSGNTSSPIAINRFDSGGILNYYLPQCPTGITGVHSYQALLYPEVWRNVEAVFTGNSDGLKYYIIVMPGGDTSLIKLKYNGADSVNVIGTGEMEMYSHYGNLKQGVPEVYQMDSSGNRVNLTWAASYYSPTSNQIKFHLGAYDANIPLIIQMDRRHLTPFLSPCTPQSNLYWTTYVGEPQVGSDMACDITTDNAGNSYMIGCTQNLAFPVFAGYQMTLIAPTDGYFTKFNKIGQSGWPYNITWSTYYGGSGPTQPQSIAINNISLVNHESYIVGFTSGNFPFVDDVIHMGAFNQDTYGGGNVDAFIVRLNDAGIPTWASYIGGSLEDKAMGVAFNESSQMVYVVGETVSSGGTVTGDFPCVTSPSGTYNQTANNSITADGNGFVMRFDNTNVLRWSSLFGGDIKTWFRSVACFTNAGYNPNGIAIGGFSSSDNATVPTIGIQNSSLANSTGILQLCFTYSASYCHNNEGFDDALLVSFDNSDNLVWSTFYGGTGTDITNTNCIAISHQIPDEQNIYLLGFTQSIDFPLQPFTDGYNQSSFGGINWDCFVLEFGSLFSPQWATYFGGSGDETEGFEFPDCAITIDANSNVYIGGSTRSSTPANSTSMDLCVGPTNGDFPYCNRYNCYQCTAYVGDPDAFIAAFNSGNQLFWSTYMGATDNAISGLSYDNSNNILYFVSNSADEGANPFPQQHDINNFYYRPVNIDNISTLPVIGCFTGCSEFTDGITKIKKNKTGELLVFPNPTSDILNIVLELPKQALIGETTLKIVDVMGREVFEQSDRYGNLLQTNINIANLTDGIYVLQLITDDKIYNQRFIKD